MTDKNFSRKLNCIHYCSFISNGQEALRLSLETLSDQLYQHYPDLPQFDLQQVRYESKEKLTQSLINRINDSDETLPIHENQKIFLLCSQDDPFVEQLQTINSMALWGIAVPTSFAVAWVKNEYLWWHEALHLFNAQDCYNKFGFHKCPEEKCIMQYSPTRDNCGGRLHLCSKNQKRIANYFQNQFLESME